MWWLPGLSSACSASSSRHRRNRSWPIARGLQGNAGRSRAAPARFRSRGHQGLTQPAVVTSGRLEDRPLNAMPSQPSAQRPAAELVVGEAAGLAVGPDMRVEPTLAEIDAGDSGYPGRVPVLRFLGLWFAGLKPLHPCRAHGTGCADPPPARGWGETAELPSGRIRSAPAQRAPGPGRTWQGLSAARFLTYKPRAGKPHAGFDERGEEPWSRWRLRHRHQNESRRQPPFPPP